MPQNNSEQGNVFLIILIAVVLFGALIFTFSRSGSEGMSTISKQEAKIAAQEILNYARLVEGAVDRVRRDGCSENEISFENPIIAGYTNPNAPGDNSCHIFNDNGGKLSWTNPPGPSFYNDPAFFLGKYYFIDAQWIGHGCDNASDKCNDLIIGLVVANKNTCDEINKLINLDTDIIDASNGGDIFQGSFSHSASHIYADEASSAVIAGQSTACITKAGQYGFIHVLLAR